MNKKDKIIYYRNRGYSAKETHEKMKDDVTLSYVYKIRSDYKKKNIIKHNDSSKKGRIQKLLNEKTDIESIAAQTNSSIQYVYKVLRELCKQAHVAKLPKKKYNIIYADPPWQYKAGKNKSADNHYNTLNINQIYSLPVANIAADDCVLFLWVTFPLLQEGLKTIERWGFEYKTIAFNWVKTNPMTQDSLFWGLGHWTRSNSEICLLATRGKPQRIATDVHSVVMSPIQHHSKKPDEIRHRIVDLLGDLPRIELFARHRHEGWDSWGNEV